MQYLSEHFTFEELTISQTAARLGYDNTPNAMQLEAAKSYLVPGLEHVRLLLNAVPMHVSSGFRSGKVNLAVGGATTSAHCFFYACDFIAPDFGTPLDICKKIEASTLLYDQLIHEYGAWCHISFDPKLRRQSLTINADGQGYRKGLS